MPELPDTKQTAAHPQTLLRKFTANLPRPRRQLLFWIIAAAGIILDLWTKFAIFDWIHKIPTRSYSIIDGILQIVAVENAGAAFGLAYGQRYLLTIIAALALILIIPYFLISRGQPLLVHIALAMFTAGIAGNLYDRLFNAGRVRDFIDVVYWPGKHWPAFNVADSLLCVGVAIMIIAILTEKPCRKPAPKQK